MIYRPAAFVALRRLRPSGPAPCDHRVARAGPVCRFASWRSAVCHEFSRHSATLHYDTALRTAGKIGTFIDGPFLISEWRELTDPAERVVLP